MIEQRTGRQPFKEFGYDRCSEADTRLRSMCGFSRDGETPIGRHSPAVKDGYSQVSCVVVVRNASKSSRHWAGVVLSGSMPV
jgi:hypothetical protein